MHFIPSFLRRGAVLGALLISFAAVAAPAVGDIAPVELGINTEGDPVKVSDYAGKVVVVSFWATWCKYCLKELPVLEGIQKAAPNSVQVIALNTEDRDVFRKAARALKSSLTLLLARDVGEKASAVYGVKGIPHLLIIGRDGRIVKVYRGYGEEMLDGIVADLNKAIQTPLAETAQAK